MLATSRAILFVTAPFAPRVDGLNTAPQAAKVIASDGSLLGVATRDGTITPVHITDLPPHVRQAVLASEDADFYEHSGINPSAVVRATVNMATGSGTQGGSTITQQLAKLNYTTGERTFLRKLREVMFASRLEHDYTKDQLLERYLNQVYFGDRAYGIEAAAQKTFGVHAAQLTPEQAAALAVRIRSPNRLDPRSAPDAVLKRRNAVLAIMASHHWLTADEARVATAAPLVPIASAPDAESSETQILTRARTESQALQALGGTVAERESRLATGALVLETAIDPAAQLAANETAARLLDRPSDPSAAIVSVKPGDGAISVLVGDSRGGGFDAATVGRRQPGSSYKPYTYLAALEAGINPATTTFDSSSPRTLGTGASAFTVRNAEPGSGGPMTIDDATVESVNVVYSQLVVQVGPQKVVDVAQRLGQPGDLQANPSIALGGLKNGVSPLDQAASYATFAAKGTYATPYLVTRIRDARGGVIWQHEKQTRSAIDEKEAGVVNDVLQRVVTRGTGRGAGIGRPVAGKTGTTNDSVDAWFVGYTPDLATAVWVGHIEASTPVVDHRGKPMFGGAAPAEIFAATMRAALAKVPPHKLATNTPADLGLSAPTTSPAPTTAPAATATTAPAAVVVDRSTVTGPTTTVATAPSSTISVPPVGRACASTTTSRSNGRSTSSSASTTTTSAPASTSTTTLPPC